MRKLIFSVLLALFFVFIAGSVSAQEWVADEQVTIVGKGVARAGHFIDWVLQYPQWNYIQAGNENPIAHFWKNARNISYAYLILFLLVVGFILVLNRGKNLTIKQLIPRIIIVILGITMSFAIMQFIYQVTDIVQGYLLKLSTDTPLSSKDLLSVGFSYEDFEGFRLDGAANAEAGKTTLFLTKMTTYTYYVMGSILLLRKAFMWLFIAVSPLFVLLIIMPSSYRLLKFLFGNLMRWLLYGPLFFLFVAVYITLWKIGMPLPFDFLRTDVVYPNGVNILLAGPGQAASLENNLNTPDTFIYYITALLMLWLVMLLPFLITHLFIKNFNHFIGGNRNFLNRVLNLNLMNKIGVNNVRPTKNATYFSSTDPNSRMKDFDL